MTTPDEREMLQNDILAAVVGEDFASNAEELEDAQRIADHLLSLGWCRRDAVLREARLLVNSQAEDHGLWFIAETCAEAYLQQELRKLHATVEAITLTPQARKEEEKCYFCSEIAAQLEKEKLND